MLVIKTNIRVSYEISQTARKLFGSYFHSSVRHRILQYQIVSIRTANSEKEVATFNSLKTFANIKYHHCHQVVTNPSLSTT